jgi:isoleucyl-tRNA synthetase
MDEQPKKSFKDTLNLPTTKFEIRANPKKQEPEILKKWQDSGV